MLSLKPKHNPGDDSYRALLISYKKEIEEKDQIIKEKEKRIQELKKKIWQLKRGE